MVRIKIWPFPWMLSFVGLTLLQFFNLFGYSAWPFACAILIFQVLWIQQIRKGRLFLFPIGVSFLTVIALVGWVQNVIQRDVVHVVGGLFLFAALFWLISRMGMLLGMAYSRPYRRWYEGRWSEIPGIDASVDGLTDQSLQLKFHRIDTKGAWVFGQPAIQMPIQSALGKEILLNWSDKEREIQPLKAKVVSFQKISGIYAFGLQFLYEDGYHERRITQWIESWEGEGRCGIWVSPKPWFEFWF